MVASVVASVVSVVVSVVTSVVVSDVASVVTSVVASVVVSVVISVFSTVARVAVVRTLSDDFSLSFPHPVTRMLTRENTSMLFALTPLIPDPLKTIAIPPHVFNSVNSKNQSDFHLLRNIHPSESTSRNNT